jgi:hypothetical protein
VGAAASGATGEAGPGARLAHEPACQTASGPIHAGDKFPLARGSRLLETSNRQFSRADDMDPYVKCTGHPYVGN